MTQTIETLAERLTRLEKAVTALTLQLSQLGAAPPEFHTPQKPSEAETLHKMREHFGIIDIQLLPLSELRKSLARHGIRAEENEFSRAILEEREK